MKSERVFVRLNPQNLTAAKEYAEEAGMTLSDLLKVATFSLFDEEAREQVEELKAEQPADHDWRNTVRGYAIKSERVSFRLTASDIEQIERISRKTGASKSLLTSTGLKKFFDG